MPPIQKKNKQMTALSVTVAAVKLQVETANPALVASQAAQRPGNNNRGKTHQNDMCQTTVGPMVAALAEHTQANPAPTKTQVTKQPPPKPTAWAGDPALDPAGPSSKVATKAIGIINIATIPKTS
jgi:hypothetical protein